MPEPLLKRLYIYQKERFPLLVHGLLIAAFSFSAIGYSRLCRDAAGFIPWTSYLACVFTNLALFFLLRVSDEYKDQHDDAAYRQYLPVVRGLISLKELLITSLVFFGLALAINIIWFPRLLPLLLLALGYLLLMRYEFGIGHWLRKRMHWYVVTHMIIIPLADIYASSYDWKLAQVAPPKGLLFFFGVSFLNGIVLEIGRKIRSLEREETGVDSYTKLWGMRGAPLIWLTVLTLNFILAVVAARYAHAASAVFIAIALVYGLAVIPAVVFIYRPAFKWSKAIEVVSLVWALTMYLALGGIPQLWSVFFK